jgi:hypothetical protein
MHFLSINNTAEFYTTRPPSSSPAGAKAKQIEREKWEVRNILSFFSGRISTDKGPRVICDLTFLVYCTFSYKSKGFTELRDTLSKQIHMTLLQES